MVSDLVIDHLEGRSFQPLRTAHVCERCGLEHDIPANVLTVEEIKQAILAQRARAAAAAHRHAGGQLGKERTPGAVGAADDFVVRALAADVFVGGNGCQDRDALRLFGKGLSFAGAVILVDDHAGNADITARACGSTARQNTRCSRRTTTAGRWSRRR